MKHWLYDLLNIKNYQFTTQCKSDQVTQNKKKWKITQIDLHISPLCRAGPAGPIFTILACGFLSPTCGILSRLVKGLGATAPQNRGFPTDFECRCYNSVTHYVLHCYPLKGLLKMSAISHYLAHAANHDVRYSNDRKLCDVGLLGYYCLIGKKTWSVSLTVT